MNGVFYQDRQWYAALSLAVLFWGVYGVFIGTLQFKNLFDFPNILFYSVLIYPVLEEIVFRGVIQENLYRWKFFQMRFIGISLSNVSTSLLFAASHLLHQSPLWALSIFFPSLVFGYFKDRHQNLSSCILLHIFYNLGFFVLIR